MSLRVGLLAIALMALGGCATLSDEECLAADWRSIGIADGAQGRTLARLETYREDCADVGVSPDAAAYAYGREIGLIDYCRPTRAYAIGLSGGQYQGVCPAEADAAFRTAWRAGLDVHEWDERAQAAERAESLARRDLREARERAATLEAQIAATGDAGARSAYASELRRVAEEIGRSESRIETSRREASAADAEAERLRERYSALYRP